ncbi:MDR family MFS transporter [Nakamurella deserti]|uniref:MDR family MFS transporter n=1 Tax=Nakamurella deserti TaxID=2164074 RepID=UPI000DBE490E|nr:MDR family MFS transporter [Nakamurella deserti]
MTTAPTQVESQVGLTHKQILTILGGLMAGMLLAALDQTIVSTSIRTIADDLGQLSGQAWATTAYLITSTITTPLYGKLSDLYGRRPLFIAAISIFVAGSVLSGVATSMTELAAFRAVQGLGAGGLFSLALAILADIVPPRERSRYQGMFLAVFGTSSVIGPIIGGFFAGADTIFGVTGWRWVFLINVPIGIVALAVVLKVLHIPHTRREHRIDWWGAVALVVGMVPLLLVAEQGNKWGWTSAASLVSIVVGVLGIVGFVLIERRMGDDALIPMRLFANRQFSQGLVVNVLIGLAMFGALATLPLYLQLVKGATPTQSGLWLLPMMVGLMGGSISSGIITGKTGRYKIFPVVGTALLIVAFAMMLALIKVDTPYLVLAGTFLVLGAGLGLNMQTMMMAVQNTVKARDIGVATSSATFFRATGGTIGTAVFLSLLFNGLPTNVNTQVQAVAGTPGFQQALASSGSSMQQYGAQLAGLSEDSAFINTLPATLAQPVKQGFVDSTHVVYILAGIVAVLAFLLVLLLKEVPLRTKSALQEIQEEDAAAAAAAGNVGLNDAAGAERERQQDDDLVTAGSAPTVEVTKPSGGRHRRD